MDRGIYIAASGGLIGSKRIDIVGNNLANVNTVGFKAQRMVNRQQEFADTLANTATQNGIGPNNSAHAQSDQVRMPGVVHINTVTDFSPGPIAPTENPLNVALTKPNQFFVVKTPQGDAYTRAGNFTLNAEGTLITPDGMPVQGEGGQITATGVPVKIASNGNVTSGDEVVGRLRVVEFSDTKNLQRSEGVRFTSAGGGSAPQTVEADLVPGSLEMANINVVDAMVEMISAQKSFETYAKSVQTISELNDISLRTPRTG